MRSISELLDLKGRVALVTGAAGRIGGAVCDALAELGAGVVLLDVAGDRAEELKERLCRERKCRAAALAVDLRDHEALRRVPAQVAGEFGRLDIVIHSAALVGLSNLQGWAVPFAQQRDEPWPAALDVNLTSAFVLVQACAPMLKASGNGAVVNIASIYGLVGPDMRLYEGTPLGNPAAYAASKGGLIQLTRWLATALAPEIRVNALSPGGVWSGQPEAFRAAYEQRTPLRRMATVEDIKGAAVYLASDASRYVTGHNLVVDGGWTAW